VSWISGNYSWGSEAITRKTRLLNVVYNASNNELVRTNTLVKNSIIQIDATPFRQWYESHYGIALGKKRTAKDDASKHTETKATKTAAKEPEGKAEKSTGAEAKAAGKSAAKATPKATPKATAKATGKAAAKATGKEAAKSAAKPVAKEAETKSATKTGAKAKEEQGPKKQSKSVKRKLHLRAKTRVIDPAVEDQFITGRLYACVTSRPGQCGRCDGYILEGKELEFYLKKIKGGKKGTKET